MNIDLSQFNNVDLSKEDYKSTFRMQQVEELNESIDSLEVKFKDIRESYASNFIKTNGIGLLEHEPKDSILNDSLVNYFKNPSKIYLIINGYQLNYLKIYYNY